MRRHIISSLVLAAFMAVVPAMSIHAKGWQQVDSNWVYIDDNNNRVRNEWRQSSDRKSYWLGSDGYMLTNSLVDDGESYVGADGAAVTEQWAYINDKDGNYWAYFNNRGKKIRDDWKKVADKWYHFDHDGKMQTGWILEESYHMGEDGAMYTGWHRLLPPNNDSDRRNHNNNSDDDKRWFYFANNGKKYVPENGSAGEKKIGDNRYAFDSNGAMLTGWVNIVDDSNDTISDFRYYNSDGSIRTGWYSIQPPDGLSSRYDNEVEWFYFNNQGVPRASETAELRSSDILKISDRSYLFNNNGTPVYGLKKVYTDGSGNYTAYYFGNASQCFVHTGKRSIKQDDNTTESYYFQEGSGKGYTGVKENHLYYMGRLQKADSYSRYMVFSIRTSNSSSHTNYLVNTSGRVLKSAKVKDKDGVEYRTNASGVLTQVNGSSSGVNSSFNTPVEPYFD